MTQILTFSSLYPNEYQPQHGIFVERRLQHLVKSGEVNADVVAPVPWFPFASLHFGRYRKYAKIPAREKRHGIRVFHPRYFTIPKVGMTVAPGLMAISAGLQLRRLASKGIRFELIDAHYFYPDGVAAVILGLMFGKPVVITARGTDINMIPNYRFPRSMIRWAARRAGAIIAVSNALKEKLVELGVDPDHITVLRNGVDLDYFLPADKAEARRYCGGWSGTWLLSVGNLIELKGHHLVIEALTRLPGISLAIIGEGPLEASLKSKAEKMGVSDRVHFIGAVEQEVLRYYYSAADALVLASSREGMANVLLESMACGLPVVATAIGGTPEVIAAPEAGRLTEERSPAAVASAVQRLLANYPDRNETRRYAEQFSWDATTEGQIEVFRRVSACI